MNIRSKILFAAIAATFAAGNAVAADATDSMTVSAEIVKSCVVAVADLDFGQIDPLDNAANATDGSADITVTCSNTTDYEVALSGGGAADTGARQMSFGADTLDYALFSDGARSANWGDDDGVDTVGGTGTGVSQTHTIYGQVASGQNTAPVGAYSDTITVTVTY